MDGSNIFCVSKCPTDFRPFHLPADIQDDRSACALSQHTACQVSETSAEQNNGKKKTKNAHTTCLAVVSKVEKDGFMLHVGSVSEAGDSKTFHPAFLVANTSNNIMLNASSKPPRAWKSLWGKSVEVRAACTTVSSLCLFV